MEHKSQRLNLMPRRANMMFLASTFEPWGDNTARCPPTAHAYSSKKSKKGT
jgi:hypothetical protein